MASSADKILSMVDVAGGPERLTKYRQTVSKMLPSDLEQERYWTIYAKLASDFIANPKITNKASVLQCMFNAAKFGLNPDPVFGHIYFIPYSGTLTYQLGYKGMVEMAYRSGKVRSVRSGLIYEGDEWDYYEDEKGQHFLHRPNFGTTRGAEVLGYSIFTGHDGQVDIHVMESEHIEKIKKLATARTSNSPWSNPLFEPEMRKKTVVRRHWKMQPKSAEIAKAIEDEERLERGEAQNKNVELEGVIEQTELALNTPETVEELIPALATKGN